MFCLVCPLRKIEVKKGENWRGVCIYHSHTYSISICSKIHYLFRFFYFRLCNFQSITATTTYRELLFARQYTVFFFFLSWQDKNQIPLKRTRQRSGKLRNVTYLNEGVSCWIIKWQPFRYYCCCFFFSLLRRWNS